MSATPEQIAERLDAWAEEEREAARYHEAGGSFSIMGACEAQEDKLRAAAALIRAQAERVRVLEEALKPFADAIEWEEAEGNFGVLFMEGAPAQRFRDEVELRFVAWWGKDEELESADTFCTLGDLRRAARALKGAA